MEHQENQGTQRATTAGLEEKNFWEKLGFSLLTAFLTGLYFLFVLPWRLWTFAVSELGKKNTLETFNEAFESDVPLMNSWVVFWNALIVTTPIFIIIFMGLLGNYFDFNDGFGYALLMAYFSPLFITFFKEAIYLPISIANNIKKISNK